MKKIHEKTDFISTLIMIALGVVMLMTHTWIFGIFGAAYCIWLAFFAESEKKRAKARRARRRLNSEAGASLHPVNEVKKAKIIELPYVG